MKKLLLITAALIGLLVSCRDPSDGNRNNIIEPNQRTVIVFDNTQGICAATVFNDHRRRDEDKIAEIPAGVSSREIKWTPGTSVPFYFSYRINLKGISGFTLHYIPKEVGKDQVAVRIDENIKTTIKIPKLDETVSSPDTLLSDKSFLLIQNNSSYSFQLYQGSSEEYPDSSYNSAVVNSGERAQYTITPGAASNYQLLVSPNYITFPDSIVNFEAGRVYSFIFDGDVSLVSEVPITLENVAEVSPNNHGPQMPGTPTIRASNGLLTVSWTAVEGAEIYEVYISTEQNPPALPVKTVFSTTTVLTELINRTVYYVWVKAVNENGASDFSPRARGIPWSANAVPAVPERPVIIPGINQLTVNWEECGGASSYEVYISTTTTTPSSATVTTDKTSAVISNLENNVIYYIWVRAVNNAGKSGYSPVEAGTPRLPTVAPATPGRPVLIADYQKIAVSWQAVEFASAYEVWIGTSDNSGTAQKYGGDVTGTETVITGLTNEQTYYVWIKAKNVVGTSGFSLPANAKPSAFLVLPKTPNAPTVISGNKELTVSWTQAEGALFYEVWTGATNNSANAVKHGADISGTLTTLTGLDNWTTYYVWVKAKNNVGTSGFSPVASGMPLGERSPGLYRNNTKIGNQNLSAALSYISANAVSGDDFYIVLGSNESVSPTTLNYSGKTVGITLMGYGGERTITLASNGSMFTVNTGVTLTLDENITLVGINTNNAALVHVSSNGTFTMNSGTISGNTTNIDGSIYGGGIYVVGGTFIMNGGTISGNKTISDSNGSYGSRGGGIYVASGTFTMNDGTISGNTVSGRWDDGGGVFLYSGTFTMNGGTISGNTANNGGGICINQGTTLTMYGGTISGNTATNGGGIYTYSGTFKKLPSGGGQNSGIIYGNEETGVDANGVPLKNTASSSNSGHAVYSSSARRRNTTAGQTDYIDSTTGRGLSANGNAPFGE